MQLKVPIEKLKELALRGAKLSGLLIDSDIIQSFEMLARDVEVPNSGEVFQVPATSASKVFCAWDVDADIVGAWLNLKTKADDDVPLAKKPADEEEFEKQTQPYFGGEYIPSDEGHTVGWVESYIRDPNLLPINRHMTIVPINDDECEEPAFVKAKE